MPRVRTCLDLDPSLRPLPFHPSRPVQFPPWLAPSRILEHPFRNGHLWVSRRKPQKRLLTIDDHRSGIRILLSRFSNICEHQMARIFRRDCQRMKISQNGITTTTVKQYKLLSFLITQHVNIHLSRLSSYVYAKHS